MINSRDFLLEREKEIIRLLSIFLEQNLNFIIVGGYAIATYKKRFSIDLDVVIKEEDLSKFENLCKKERYALVYGKQIELLYGEKFKRFEKKIGGLPVNVDFLINGLVSRTTDSTWSFDYIEEYSSKGILGSMKFFIPEKELLIAMKLHSGRLSDTRDVVALMPCKSIDLKSHLLKGNLESLKESIRRQKRFLEKPQFDDSFKGIFGVQAYKKEDVIKTRELIEQILGWLH